MDDDVVWDIFAKLPPKSIVRFKSLSKRWNSCLSSRNFVRNHLQAVQTGKEFFAMTDNNLIVPFRVDHKFESNEVNLEVKETFRHRVFEGSQFMFCLMHCDGLLCSYTNTAIFVVWNPSTKEYKKIQRAKHDFPLALMGFGYDSVIDDYKILYITRNDKSIKTLRLKEGVWKDITPKIDRQLSFINTNLTSTFFNGCLYWIHQSPNRIISEEVILCFDLENEGMIEEISPNLDEHALYHCLSVLNGSLCLTINYRDRTDIWTLKNETRKYLVKLVMIPRFPYRSIALCGINKDQILTIMSYKLYLCNSKDGSFKKIVLKRGGIAFDYLCCVFPYTESLVSPNGSYSTY